MISFVEDLHRQYLESIPHRDVRTKNWLLLYDTPVYVWAISVLYLLFIWLGPKFMQNRRAFELRKFMILYNFGLVVLSVYMVVEMILSTWDENYSYICAPLNTETVKRPKELRIAKVLWWYFFSKFIELLDTVLMILRKKNNQVTFLHVFHHLSMLNIWWWVMNFIPGGQSFFGALMNTIVHVVMYLYYFLACFPSLRAKLWWKRYLTQFQLVQFCIICAHSVNNLVSNCDFPRWGAYLLSGYTIILFTLFSNFYLRSYLKKSAARSDGDHPSAVNGKTMNGHFNGYRNNNKANKKSS